MSEVDLFGLRADPLADLVLDNLRKLKQAFGEGAHTMPPAGQVVDYGGAIDVLDTWLSERCPPPVKCSECQEEIRFLKLPNGKKAPVDFRGSSHFTTCSNPEKFRKK